MAEIVMPRLSDTMEEGTILRWLREDGEQIARGDELVEIETDKATMVYESDQAGVLERVAPEGATLAVGELIAHVGEGARSRPDGHAATAAPPAGDGRAEDAAVVAQPAAAPQAASVPVPAPGAPAAAPQSSVGAARLRASPLARRIARERGIELAGLAGSGPGGRIVKADVERAGSAGGAPGGAPTAAPAAGAPQATGVAAADEAATHPSAALEGVMTAKGQATTVALTRTQQTIARRMAESRATIPDFTLQIDVDLEACVELRSTLKQLSRPGGEAHEVPTYNDMVVKASALALREHPRVNASYRDGELQLHSRVNVGVAVAAADALVVPTVFDADSKALGEIAREARTLAARVRDGTITPPELGGGTFTVSNLGMYGVRSFAAIINPPQVAILSVGALAQRAVVRQGELSARHTVTLTLACDHRVLYGADAAQFAARIRELLEAPTALTL